MAGQTVDLAEILRLLSTAGVTGALCYVVFMLGTGRWVPRAELERERARADKLQDFATDELVPALTRATDALKEAQIQAAVRRQQP